MSGIIGVFNLSSSSDPMDNRYFEETEQALKLQSHRGTDDSGACVFRHSNTDRAIWKESPKSFYGDEKYDGIIGCCRMKTIKTESDADVPMLLENGMIVVAFDGELYNRRELMNIAECDAGDRELTDEEIIGRVYVKNGFAKTVSLLNGMFSLVVVDLRIKTCFVARDRLGIKPIYFLRQNDKLMFSSELKGFTAFRCFEKQIDIDAYNARLIFSRPGSKVLYKNVEMLNPGEFITATFNGDVKTEKYFSIDNYQRTDRFSGIGEALEELDALLEDAVRRQIDFDVPFATQVSGGIDSTLVNYYIKKLKGESFRKGISIVDGTGQRGEEYWIDRVAEKFDLELSKYQLDETFFLDNYKKLVWFNDAPIYKPYFTSFYKMANAAAGDVKVLLSGEGADETAGGYGRFAAGAFQPFFTGNGISGKNITTYSDYAAYAVNSDTTIKGFTTIGYDNTDGLINEQMEIFSGFSGSNFTKQLKYETYCRLPESFMRQEKMASANSVEIRVPLVDNKVLDFIMQLPENMLLAFAASSPVGLSENPFEWIQGKYIFKELCAGKMGREFAYRNKQIIVFDERNILKSAAFASMFYDEVLPSMKKRGLIDAGQIQDWYSRISDITKKEFDMMWRAISLETWCGLFLNDN